MLKDDALAAIAKTRNVAQFVSFSSGPFPAVRHHVLRGAEEGMTGADALIRRLIDISDAGTVNVRTFDPSGKLKSNPFHYGVSDQSRVAQIVSDAAQRGLYSIVNETIDIHDGGVSGVSMPGLLEFAPGATPRVVEQEDAVVSIRPAVGISILEAIYGHDVRGIYSDRERIEFSIHPGRRGFRREHAIIWEVADTDDDLTNAMPLAWPNPFSRFIGDKAFGLMVADAEGFLVPKTTVISRNVRTFTFGTTTGTGEAWLRTCPREPRPGRFSTIRGWVDPFKLLRDEDPFDSEISSVLDQDGVDARWSGATARVSGRDVIEGVGGSGDEFMLGAQAPMSLPIRVRDDVALLLERLRDVLGDCRVEWAHDGDSVWVLQLHRVAGEPGGLVGAPEVEPLGFDPKDGLEALHLLVRRAVAEQRPIRVLRRIGATSHVGEVLRQANVPYEIAR